MLPFHKMGFQKKMILSYMVMILLIGTVALLFSYQMTKVTSEETHLTQRLLPQMSALLEVKNQMYAKTYALKMYTLTRDPGYLQEYSRHFITRNQFQEAEKTQQYDDLLAIIRLLNELDFIFLNQIDPLIKANNVQAINYVLQHDVEPRIEQLENKLSLSLSQLDTKFHAEFLQSNHSLRVSLLITYTVSVLSILFGLFCSFYFRKELLQPIQSLIKQVREVSRGTFGQQITYSTKDDFYELAQEINKMSLNIADLFAKGESQNRVLQEEKRVREQILNSLPVGIITCHHPTSEIHINEKAQQLVALDENSLPLSPDQHVWHSETPWFENRTITLYNKQGEPFHALTSYVPLLDQERDELGWMVVLTDITEQIKVQEYMHQSEKLSLVGQLAAGAAHEIRNPLTVIYGFMQLLQGNLSADENQKYHLPLIVQEIERVNKIVTELLLLSKPSRPNYREVQLGEIFASILPLMKGEAALHGIEIIEAYSGDIVFYADVEQLKQVLLNLMKNGLEAMPNGGELIIRSEQDDSMIQIVIQDTGVGISPEHVIRIFDPFFSLKEEGTGLGLPISMRMVKNHGGDMSIDSKLGVGTSITISLPKEPSRTI